MFPNSFGLEQGLVAHLDVGVHVADVAVAVQVHVTKFSNSNQVAGVEAASTWRHVR